MVENGRYLASVEFVSICYLIGSLSYNSALLFFGYLCSSDYIFTFANERQGTRVSVTDFGIIR